MQFRIADTFTASLARLTADEQKAAKTTAFDLQLNPGAPGLHFHRLEHGRDRHFWSVRVSADVRLIVHRTEDSLLLCYVAHHDKAYDWAERRKLETHPTTGAAQLVEVRETVREIIVPSFVDAPTAVASAPVAEAAPLFSQVPDRDLLAYGVPPEWLDDVRAATEDSLFALADHLPAEAAEALLELATGGTPRLRIAAPTQTSPFEHPDAQRRFRVLTNVGELERAFEYPWDQWSVFLHPEQRAIVERSFGGPARVAGSAGTGKTVVALHRAVFLARQSPEARVLLTTFSETLARALGTQLRRLIAGEPRLGERVEVHSLDAIAERLYRVHVGPLKLAGRSTIQAIIEDAARHTDGHNFAQRFLRAEWEQVVDAWQLDGWEAYRDVHRLGRRTRLPESQRRLLWSIFDRVRDALAKRGEVTRAAMFTALARRLGELRSVLFDYVVVDEAQDFSMSQLRFLAALGGGRDDALFFAGDLGQRIFQQPFSWKSLGVDVRGRSHVLRVNYRTSHQIRARADRLLSPVQTDVDGAEEDRSHTVSVFNGPAPLIRVFDSWDDESAEVARWIQARVADGLSPHEIGVFVRSDAQVDRARGALVASGVPFRVLDDAVQTVSGLASAGTMHLAKGLEFRAVVVMACDDEVIPLQERIETVGEDADLKEVYDTERHLLYVACTRARDHLLVTGVAPESEFLDDMRQVAK